MFGVLTGVADVTDEYRNVWIWVASHPKNARMVSFDQERNS